MDTLEIAANMVLNAVDTMSTKFSAHVKDEINTKVSSLYKPGGSATLATLPALTAENSGYVYDMAEAFTTTANFREGAGHAYPAGTNVVVSDVGGDTYKYDVLSGMLDGYVKDTRKVGNVPLSADIPVNLTGDTAITVTNTGTASAIGYSITLNDSGVTAGSKGDASAQTPGFGGTFKTLSATVDAKGRLTALNENNVTIPTATATTAANGLMSGTDKSKLDGIAAGATANAAATVAPLMDGAASVGTATKYAREDHRHPVDTSRASAAEVEAIKTLLRNAVLYLTASGNPATFSDGAAANVRDLTVTITPTQSGSGDPSPTNVRPISGVSSVAVTRTGKNLCGELIAGQGISYGNGGVFNDQKYSRTDYIQVKGGETYTAQYTTSGGENWYYDAARNPLNGMGSIYNTRIRQIAPQQDGYIRLTCNSAEAGLLMLERGDAASAYEPYRGQSVTVTLTDGANPLTVYGGTLDVTAGTLSVTWANIASYNGETLPGRWISDRDAYAPGTSPTTGAQVVYELAAPVAYTLTPQQLATLAGYNSVSANAGSVAVEYRADVALSLDALASNLTNAILSLGAGF